MMSLHLFVSILASLSVETVLAPDHIPTYMNKKGEPRSQQTKIAFCNSFLLEADELRKQKLKAHIFPIHI